MIQTASSRFFASKIRCLSRWSQWVESSTFPTMRFCPTSMHPAVSRRDRDAASSGRQLLAHTRDPCRNIPARDADLRQNLARHPALERLCLLQLRGEDEGVKAAFVDDRHLLSSSKGVTFRYPLVFFVNMVKQSFSGIAVPQRNCHILAHYLKRSSELCRNTARLS